MPSAPLRRNPRAIAFAAWRDSWSRTQWPGWVASGLGGLGAAIVTQLLDWSATASALITLIVLVLALPLANVSWRLLRGPLSEAISEINRLQRRVAALESELDQLRAPDTLAVHVEEVGGVLSSKPERVLDIEPGMGGALLFSNVGITNRSTAGMALVFEVKLDYPGADDPRRRRPLPIQVKRLGRTVELGVEPLPLGGQGTIAIDLGWLLSPSDMQTIGSLDDVPMFGHRLRIIDRVSGGAVEVEFNLLAL